MRLGPDFDAVAGRASEADLDWSGKEGFRLIGGIRLPQSEIDVGRAVSEKNRQRCGKASPAARVRESLKTSLDFAFLPREIVDNRQSTGVPVLSSELSMAPGIARLPKSTFREHIAEQLRSAILAGQIPPGAPIVETALAGQFQVSRGPLREALRQLVEEGLLVTVPYTGTHVISLSVEDVREIHSLRVTLECFAFEQAWDRRDAAFRSELQRRHATLIATIDEGDDRAAILAELDLHGLVYEASGHRLLQRTWSSLRGRLQLYWAAHHRAHSIRGPKRDGHESYVAAALGDDLDAMRAEITTHMKRGGEQTEKFLRDHAQESGDNKRGEST